GGRVAMNGRRRTGRGAGWALGAVAAIPAAFALLLTVRAASGQGGAGAGAGPEPSPLIYPPQAMPLAFNHARHLKLAIGCDTCHTTVPRAAMATRADLPMMSLCLGCHTGGAGTWQPLRKPAPAPPAAAPPTAPAAAAEPELPLEPGAEDEPEVGVPAAGP